jgi:polyhydroxyalkanoate synthesis regulator phasin
MIELIEKSLLTAMGAVALSQQKTEDLLQDLKQRFQVSETEGKEFISRLEQLAKENQKKLEETAQKELIKSADRLGLVSRVDFDKLARKVARLEKKLKEADA